ncbi:citryl-CoA lyase [soil metagenome]
MSQDDAAAKLATASTWWTTSIIDIKPGEINVRGLPIEQLIGAISYPQMVWLMLRGELPDAKQARLLEATLVAGVDHGPHAPSIAISRMAVTCGLPLNGAMASAINVLDDIHGGAGQQCMELLHDIVAQAGDGAIDESLVEAAIDRFIASHGKIIPGFGHRFHHVDPRAVKLMAMVEAARSDGVLVGRFAQAGALVERVMQHRKGSPIPMNIDGATAVIYCELGFAAELGRGLFILSRSVGILAHAWEQKQQGGRIKGPQHPVIPYTYQGPARHDLPGADSSTKEQP